MAASISSPCRAAIPSARMGWRITPPAPMGVATGINFQPTGGGKAAITGDFVLTGEEVNPVIQALRANGIDVTAIHSHMLDEQPRLFFVHFWANDDASSLPRACARRSTRRRARRAEGVDVINIGLKGALSAKSCERPCIFISGHGHDRHLKTIRRGQFGELVRYFLRLGSARFRRSGGAGRPDGARTRQRTQMAHQGANARGHRDLPVAAWTARDPGRHLRRLSARRVLGRLGRRLGFHPAELRHRRRTGRALRLSRRPASRSRPSSMASAPP